MEIRLMNANECISSKLERRIELKDILRTLIERRQKTDRLLITQEIFLAWLYIK